MEELERAALFEAVCSWVQDRYGYERLPFGPAQVSFYDRVVDDLIGYEGAEIELEPTIWEKPRPWLTFGWSLVLGCLLAAVFLSLADPWGWGAFFWIAFGGGLLLIYPVLLMFHSRTVVVVTDGEEEDVNTVRQIARACLDASLLRWGLHCLLDLVLLVGWASYRRGVVQLVVEDYSVGVGGAPDRSTLPLRTQRGARLAEKFSELLGDGGLVLMLQYL